MASTALHRPQRPGTGGASSPRTAFVLSGGASLGALQVGMLEALYERGITPDFLVGTSVGALNAAFVASRLQSPQTAIELGRVWRARRLGAPSAAATYWEVEARPRGRPPVAEAIADGRG